MAGPSEVELLGRVALAAGLGMILGAERQLRAKPAGMRTHALVALGAAAFTTAGFALVDTPAGPVRPDITRIAAQVASGIGFIGAGIIIFHGDRIAGVTTAAELWAAAALGVLCGLGLLLLAGGTAGLVLVVVVGVRLVERTMQRFTGSEEAESERWLGRHGTERDP